MISNMSTSNSFTAIPERKRYTCLEEDCNASFLFEAEYTRHRAIHYPSGRWACPFYGHSCSYTFIRPDRLKEHFEKKHAECVLDKAIPLQRANLRDETRWACRICTYGPKQDGSDITYEQAEQHDLDYLRKGQTRIEASSCFYAWNLLTYSSIHRYWQPFLGPCPVPQSRSNDDLELLALIRDLKLNGPNRRDDRELARRAAHLLLLRPEDIGVSYPSAGAQVYYPSTQPIVYTQSVLEPANSMKYQTIDVHSLHLPSSYGSTSANPPGRLQNDVSSATYHVERSSLGILSPTSVQFPPLTWTLNEYPSRPSTEIPRHPSYTSTPKTSVSSTFAHLPRRRFVHSSTHQHPPIAPSTSYISGLQNLSITGDTTSLAGQEVYGGTYQPSVGASHRSTYRPPTAMSSTTDTSHRPDVLTPGSSRSSAVGGYTRAHLPSIEPPDCSAQYSPIPVIETHSDAQSWMMAIPQSNYQTAAPPQHWDSSALPTADVNSDHLTQNGFTTATCAGLPNDDDNLGGYSINTYLRDTVNPWTQHRPRSPWNSSSQLSNDMTDPTDPTNLDCPNSTATGAQFFDEPYHGSN